MIIDEPAERQRAAAHPRRVKPPKLPTYDVVAAGCSANRFQRKATLNVILTDETAWFLNN